MRELSLYVTRVTPQRELLASPGPAPAIRRPMDAIMLGSSLDFLYHSLCPICVDAAKDGGVIVSAYPTLRSPSFSDCIIDLLGQVVQVAFFDDMVLHDSLFPPFATFYPFPPQNFTRCARTDSDGRGVPSPS
jgi:hypothetical protein